MLPKFAAPLAGFGFGIALILALIGGAFFGVRKPKPPAPPSPVQQPVSAPAPKDIVVQGRVEAVHTIPVSTTVAGEIDSFSADVGQDVYEGQILARISNQNLETSRENAQRVLQNAESRLSEMETAIGAARVEAARAHTDANRAEDELSRASKEYERQKMLQAAGATPRNTYEKAERDHRAAQNDMEKTAGLARHADEHVEELIREYDLDKATLNDKRKEAEHAQAALAATEIHAPVGGVVVARQGEIGKSLTPHEAAELFRIAPGISALRAVFKPDPSLKVGDTVGVTFADIPGEPLPALIRTITNGEAAAEFTSSNPAIRPGISCSVHTKLK
jgi:multidrug efflux pump subunit AcrA (membrane-fusion protein)